MIFPNWHSWPEIGFLGYNVLGIPLLFAFEGLQLKPLRRGILGHDIPCFSLPSSVGWALGYGASLAVFGATAASLGTLSSPLGAVAGAAIALHFTRRLYEVLFVHRFTSRVDLEFVLNFSFTVACFGWFSAHTLCTHSHDLDGALVAAGLGIFAVGETINAYHHALLARMRAPGAAAKSEEKGYTPPRGGLFRYVLCPHYLGELVAFLGFAVMTNHLSMWAVLGGCTSHLLSLAYARRQWYVKNVKGFDPATRAIIPFVF